MGLAVDASSPAQVTKGGTGTTLVTGSFTAPPSMLLGFVAYDSSGPANNHTLTDSGGLTWTRWGRKSKDAGSIGGASASGGGGVEAWYATVVTGGVGRTVTATQASADDAAMWVKVLTDTNAPTAGAITAFGSASALPSLAVVTTAPDSWVWAVSNDWSQKGAGTFPAGQTMVNEADLAGQITGHLWRQTATTPASGTSVTMNQTAPSAQDVNMLAVEILANSAPADPGPGDLLLSGVAGGLVLTGVAGVERLSSLLD